MSTVYIVGFVYIDDIEPTIYYVTVENVDSKEDAIEYTKKRFTPIEIMEVEERIINVY